MRSARVLMACLLLMSLTAWTTQAQSATSSTPGQIALGIDPEKWYLGSDVQAAIDRIIAIGKQEIQRTSEEAVKAAVAPLLADKAQLTTERDGYKVAWEKAEDRAALAVRITAGVGVAALVVGFLVGLLL